MCELLVRVVDKPLSGKPEVDCHRTRRGDVIVAQADGAGWGTGELTSPDWVILSVPGMSLEEGLALTVGDPVDASTTRFPHKRLFRLDLDALGVAQGRDRVRQQVSVQQVRAARARKPSIVDPNVIG